MYLCTSMYTHACMCVQHVCVCLCTRMTCMLNIIVSSPGVGTLRPEDSPKYDEGYPPHHAIVLPGQDQRQGRALLAGLPPLGCFSLFRLSCLVLSVFFFLRPVFSSPHTTFGFGSYPFFLTSLFPSPFRFLHFFLFLLTFLFTPLLRTMGFLPFRRYGFFPPPPPSLSFFSCSFLVPSASFLFLFCVLAATMGAQDD